MKTKNDPNRCPVCGSPNIEWEPLTTEMYRDCYCLDCDSIWSDLFKLEKRELSFDGRHDYEV